MTFVAQELNRRLERQKAKCEASNREVVDCRQRGDKLSDKLAGDLHEVSA